MIDVMDRNTTAVEYSVKNSIFYSNANIVSLDDETKVESTF